MAWFATATSGRERFAATKWLADIHRDHDVGAHGPGHIGRHVVQEYAVGEKPISEGDRCEDAGNGHGGAKRTGQRTTVERHRHRRLEVRSHGPERYGQVVEAERGGVGQRQSTQEQPDLMSGVEPWRQT
jgi:hypothetical protein